MNQMPIPDRRRILRGLGATLLAGTVPGITPFPVAAKTLDDTEKDWLLSLVDAELRPFAAAILSRARPPLTLAAVRTARSMSAVAVDSLVAPFPPVERRTIPGFARTPDVAVAFCDGRDGKSGQPAYIHMHGGGFIGGSAFDNPPELQKLARAIGGPVVSVEYRLAPETQFPGALDDCYAALAWLHRNAETLGVDADRIAVGGVSAGAGLAAMLAIAARDRGEFRIACQHLICPMLDDRTGTSRKLSPPFGIIGWNAQSNRFAWHSLLGRDPGGDVSAGSVPARTADLSGLPPAYIAVGSLDMFMHEDVDYARRMMLAGVPVELHVVRGVWHGFDYVAPQTGIARRYHEANMAALMRNLLVN